MKKTEFKIEVDLPESDDALHTTSKLFHHAFEITEDVSEWDSDFELNSQAGLKLTVDNKTRKSEESIILEDFEDIADWVNENPSFWVITQIAGYIGSYAMQIEAIQASPGGSGGFGAAIKTFSPILDISTYENFLCYMKRTAGTTPSKIKIIFIDTATKWMSKDFSISDSWTNYVIPLKDFDVEAGFDKRNVKKISIVWVYPSWSIGDKVAFDHFTLERTAFNQAKYDKREITVNGDTCNKGFYSNQFIRVYKVNSPTESELWFVGRVKNIKKNFDEKGNMISLECTDLTDFLKGFFMDVTKTNMEVSEIVRELLLDAKAIDPNFPIVEGCIGATNIIISTCSFKDKNLYECIDELAKQSSFDWFVNAQGLLWFFRSGG